MEETNLKKSVSFVEGEKSSDIDAEEDDGTGSVDKYDSGCDVDDLDLDLQDLEVTEKDEQTRDIAVGTDLRLLYPKMYRRRARSPMRPPWRYWNNDPSPDIIRPNTPGPFRETLLQAPIEVRNQRMSKSGGIINSFIYFIMRICF